MNLVSRVRVGQGEELAGEGVSRWGFKAAARGGGALRRPVSVWWWSRIGDFGQQGEGLVGGGMRRWGGESGGQTAKAYACLMVELGRGRPGKQRDDLAGGGGEEMLGAGVRGEECHGR